MMKDSSCLMSRFVALQLTIMQNYVIIIIIIIHDNLNVH